MMESERVKWFQETARVAPPDEEGVRYVQVDGLPVGMLRQVPGFGGRWEYQWLSREGF